VERAFKAAMFVGALAFALVGRESFASDVARFAIVAGNNQGLSRSDPLKYAEHDAKRMAALFSEIGGVREENLILLEGGDPEALRRAFDEIAEELKKAGGDSVFLFYYSGHADSGYLRMGGRGISLEEIRRRLELLPAKVRVAIVDACQSGEITRAKGGKVISPFMDERPVNVKGLVIITSASAAEPAQESEILQSSFFSHHLMSGLRGAADNTGDGRISAIEAYDYAYKYTVRETEGTTAGVQHPTFLYALEGEGDIALTEIGEGRTRVKLASAMEGTVLFIGKGGQIEAEVAKKGGVPAVVALFPGEYEVRWRSAKSLGTADVLLTDNASVSLSSGSFTSIPLEAVVLKGAATKHESGTGPGTLAPLDDIPLGGGAAWSGNEAAVQGPPADETGQIEPTEPSEPEGPKVAGDVVHDSRSFAKRSDARIWPAASMGASLILPGLGQGIDGRLGKAAVLTGVFAGSVAGGVGLAYGLDQGDSREARAAKMAGMGTLALVAFYTYAYSAIDAFYSTTRGGPGTPDFKELKLDLTLSIAPSIVPVNGDEVAGGLGGGVGAGYAVHEYVVIGLRNVNVIPSTDLMTLSFAPEIRLRGMLNENLGLSSSIGMLVQIHMVSESLQRDDGDRALTDLKAGWGLLPYLSGSLHYFPARSWSLDFGIRGGVAVQTRRFHGGVAQANGAFAIEYLGGLTWYL
jgi:hypothetical protein